MTTKQAIHDIVEHLTDVQARTLLALLEAFTNKAIGSNTLDSSNVDMSMDQSHQTSLEHDPMNGIIGMFESEMPTDIEKFKDEYIAEAIASHFDTAE